MELASCLVTCMRGTRTSLDGVRMDDTVALLKARKDWPLQGIPAGRQLVLWQGRALDNRLTLAEQDVRTEVADGAGFRVCLSVAVSATSTMTGLNSCLRRTAPTEATTRRCMAGLL